MAFPLSFFVGASSPPRLLEAGVGSVDVIDLGSKIAVRLSNHVEERGRVPSLAEAARRERLAKRYVARMTRLAFVAPAIVDAVAKGRAGRPRLILAVGDPFGICWIGEERWAYYSVRRAGSLPR
jgi:hypothetical protein